MGTLNFRGANNSGIEYILMYEWIPTSRNVNVGKVLIAKRQGFIPSLPHPVSSSDRVS